LATKCVNNEMMFKVLRYSAPVAFAGALLLAGCGGGGSDTTPTNPGNPGNPGNPTTTYTATVFDKGANTLIQLNAINASGNAVGAVGSPLEAVFTQNSIVNTITNSLGGASEAFGINASGQIVGSAGSSAFVSDGTTMTDLGGAGNAVARAISDGGTIVGTATVTGGAREVPVFFDGSGNVSLLDTFNPALGGVARSINEDGYVVGTARDGSGPFAFVYDPTATAGSRVTKIANTGEPTEQTFARDINASEVIVGDFVNASFIRRAFRASIGEALGSTTELPLPNAFSSYLSEANAINDSGIVVGSIQQDQSGTGQRAVLWDANGVMTNLDEDGVADGVPADVTLVEAVDINNDGDILVIGRNGSLEPSAYLLTLN
jgi:uncharacterized membrane protein